MIIFLSLIAWLLIAIFLRIIYGDYKYDVFSSLSIVFVIILLFVSGIIMLGNYGEIPNLTSFHDVDNLNYQTTISQTRNIIDPSQNITTNVMIPIQGSIEKQQIASDLSSRLMEYRNRLEDYNQEVLSYRYFRSNPFTSWYVPEIPDRIQVITIN